MTPLHIEDFSQRYRGTFIRYVNPETKKPVVIQVSQVHGDGRMNGLLEVSSYQGSMVLEYPKCWTHLLLEPPESGYFNNNGHALYLFKYPERQWRRGICNANSEIYNPFFRLLSAGVYNCGFGYRSIQAAFVPDYPSTIADALTALKDLEVMSVAISRSIMISKAPIKNTDYILWYGLVPSATYNQNRQVFEIKDATFEQELHDELIKMRQRQWITS